MACPSDLLAQGFQSATTFTEDEIRAAFSEISFDDAPGKWFSDIQYFDTGYVEKLTVCGVEMTGVHVREALGLRSASFTVTYENGAFTFTTLGYGTAGMSQAAAITLAEGGMTVDEILARFYPGTDMRCPAVLHIGRAVFLWLDKILLRDNGDPDSGLVVGAVRVAVCGIPLDVVLAGKVVLLVAGQPLHLRSPLSSVAVFSIGDFCGSFPV